MTYFLRCTFVLRNILFLLSSIFIALFYTIFYTRWNPAGTSWNPKPEYGRARVRLCALRCTACALNSRCAQEAVGASECVKCPLNTERRIGRRNASSRFSCACKDGPNELLIHPRMHTHSQT